ncbi:hypothetical protein EKO27_g5780 [Xylaria grammica]|uniref:Uncharacterized protein n=1 Tax=Xylaria grammica TaxID=363999 RepID=A0A439D4L2_9PEZI|nr:hypothetical protein EKO27_g5780 [Xylaria grammica]
MTGERSTGLVAAMLLLASFLPVATAQTPTADLPTGLPASCTPLATLLSEYPPPNDGRVVDDALNNGLNELFTRFEATVTASTTVNRTSFCDFIISTQIPSATPSATSALSSYISAAGIWLEDHGLEEAESLHSGDCERVVQSDEDELARGRLDFVIAFGPCYELLGWDQRAAASSGATTTDASSTLTVAPTATPSKSESTQATPSPTGESSEVDTSPPSAGSRRVADAFVILGTTVCVILLLSS